MGFRGDDSGPAFEVSLFEELLGVLAGVFDLVEIGLSDGEWTVVEAGSLAVLGVV